MCEKEQSNPIIQPYSPRDGRVYDCQCARCGSSVDYIRCESCEDGFDGHDCGEDCCYCLFPEDNVTCDICNGQGGWYQCLSSREWCAANPLAGREEIARGEIEWFVSDDEQE